MVSKQFACPISLSLSVFLSFTQFRCFMIGSWQFNNRVVPPLLIPIYTPKFSRRNCKQTTKAAALGFQRRFRGDLKSKQGVNSNTALIRECIGAYYGFYRLQGNR